MAGKTRYLENKFIAHVLTGVTYTRPSAVYLALYTIAPTDAGGGTEVSGNGYARTVITFTANTLAGSASNTDLVIFPQSSGVWDSVVAWGIFDAATSGNLLYWGTTTPKTVNSGVMVKIAPAAIVITET